MFKMADVEIVESKGILPRPSVVGNDVPGFSLPLLVRRFKV
jgi:hypothetical protein